MREALAHEDREREREVCITIMGPNRPWCRTQLSVLFSLFALSLAKGKRQSTPHQKLDVPLP